MRVRREWGGGDWDCFVGATLARGEVLHQVWVRRTGGGLSARPETQSSILLVGLPHSRASQVSARWPPPCMGVLCILYSINPGASRSIGLPVEREPLRGNRGFHGGAEAPGAGFLGWEARACHFVARIGLQIKCTAVSFSRRSFVLGVCVCAMADAADACFSDGDESQKEQSGAASSAPDSPLRAASDAGSSGGASSTDIGSRSDLLQKIKELSDVQKALKEQRKKCAADMKNAMKRKKRLQGQASQLSDADLVEVLRMRKARKEMVQTSQTPQPHQDSQPAL